jgi:hypothetical protein
LPNYGSCVRAFKIDEMSTDRYNESPIGPDPVLSSGYMPWNSGGMHHIDPHLLPNGKWIACVDGWYIS